jgi:hypothetical protein
MGSTSPASSNFYTTLFPLTLEHEKKLEREKEEVLVRLIYKKI